MERSGAAPWLTYYHGRKVIKCVEVHRRRIQKPDNDAASARMTLQVVFGPKSPVGQPQPTSACQLSRTKPNRQRTLNLGSMVDLAGQSVMMCAS
jgi:hypothetical protein